MLCIVCFCYQFCGEIKFIRKRRLASPRISRVIRGVFVLVSFTRIIFCVGFVLRYRW